MHQPGAQVQVGLRGAVRPGHQRLGDTEWAKHLQRARVQDEGARRAEHRPTPLDHPDLGAIGVGLERQGEAGRAGAHHQDVCGSAHATSNNLHHDPADAGAASSRRGAWSSSSRRSPGSTW